MSLIKTLAKTVVPALLITCFAGVAMASSESRARAHMALQDVFTVEDVAVEVQFGREVAAQILGQYTLYSGKELSRYVMLVGKAVAMHASRSEITYRFAILDSDIINAYAAPGGYVFITLGAIKRMQDEAELAAVLAHEIAHITNRHIVKELNVRGEESGGQSALVALIGASSSTAQAIIDQAVDAAMTLLFQRGYQQQDELESDASAVQLLLQTGYDPQALQRYLKRVAQQGQGKAQHGNTHPPSRERDRLMKQLLESDGLNQLQLPKMEKRFKDNVQNF